MIRNMIFIGSDFYEKSGTIMSPIYEIDREGNIFRSDWGFVQTHLSNGDDIHIRQATENEMQWAFGVLGRILSRRKNDE